MKTHLGRSTVREGKQIIEKKTEYGKETQRKNSNSCPKSPKGLISLQKTVKENY